MALTTDGLVAYWHHLQGYTGTTWDNIAPATLGTNNLTAINTTLGTFGVNFNGTTAYAHMAGLTNLTSFTIDAKLYYTKVGANTVASAWAGTTDKSNAVVDGTSGKNQVYFKDMTGTKRGTTLIDSVTNGELTAIAWVYTPSTIKIYINGMQATSISLSQLPMNDRFLIGAEATSAVAQTNFGGMTISALRLYNRALTPSEVSSNSVLLYDDVGLGSSGVSVTYDYTSEQEINGVRLYDYSTKQSHNVSRSNDYESKLIVKATRTLDPVVSQRIVGLRITDYDLNHIIKAIRTSDLRMTQAHKSTRIVDPVLRQLMWVARSLDTSTRIIYKVDRISDLSTLQTFTGLPTGVMTYDYMVKAIIHGVKTVDLATSLMSKKSTQSDLLFKQIIKDYVELNGVSQQVIRRTSSFDLSTVQKMKSDKTSDFRIHQDHVKQIIRENITRQIILKNTMSSSDTLQVIKTQRIIDAFMEQILFDIDHQVISEVLLKGSQSFDVIIFGEANVLNVTLKGDRSLDISLLGSKKVLDVYLEGSQSLDINIKGVIK